MSKTKRVVGAVGGGGPKAVWMEQKSSWEAVRDPVLLVMGAKRG